MDRRTFPTQTSVFYALPLNGTDGFRAILQQADYHIYNDASDFPFTNNGLLLLHIKDVGPRTVRLRSGKNLSLTSPPASTYLIDSQLGEVFTK